MIIPQPPPLFWQRMAQLLGAEYPTFVAHHQQTSPATALRLNRLKIDRQIAPTLLPFPLKPIPWTTDGFVYDLAQSPMRPSHHPYFAAGLYYLQEPSAMAVAALLNPQPGERVLDLCAAPGGKATQIASLMSQDGLLVANEIHPQRVWELVANLERWGARNLCITQESPQKLAQKWAESFDRVLVDAPCSGEGMFRKSAAAVTDWSPELVLGCAVRQKRILEQAAQLVRPGGWLIYSTCTFAPEENEGVVTHFLSHHPQFDLVALPLLPGFCAGRADWVVDGAPELNRTVRIFPHQTVGEGHFIALFRRDEGYEVATRAKKGGVYEPLAKGDRLLFDRFWQEMNAGTTPWGEGRLVRQGSYLYQLPPNGLDGQGLRLIRPGWWLGEFKKGRFEPSYALAMGLAKGTVNRTLDWEVEDERVAIYLRGQEVEIGLEMGENAGSSGWTLATVNGYPLGWGKQVGHRLKNHYPKLWR